MFIPARIGVRRMLLSYQNYRQTLVGLRGYTAPHLHFVCSFCERFFSINCAAGDAETVTVVEVAGVPHAACACCARDRAAPAAP